MAIQEEFNRAWTNYTFVPDDPKERMRDLVKGREGVDIMYTQASRILDDAFTPPGEITAWTYIKEEVATMTDDEVVGMFYAFINKHKGAE